VAPEGTGQGLLCAATGGSEAGMAPEKTVLGQPSGADTGQHGCGHGLQGMPKHISLWRGCPEPHVPAVLRPSI